MVDARRRSLAALALAAPAAWHAGPARAQQDPGRPIRMVIPYPPGGSTDIVGRALAEAMTRELGQQVLVDNRPGGGTNIGAEAVATAKPDGHTVLFAGVQQAVNPVYGPLPPFDTLAAFEPVGLIASAPFVVAAHPSTPMRTGQELLAACRAQPDKFTVSSAQLDLFVELLNARAGMKMLHVPYKGGAQAAADAIGGQVNLVFAQVPALLAHLQSGRLRPLAVTSAKRFPGLPELPSFTELGVEYDVNPWFGLLAPAGTPKPVVERTTQAMRKVLNGEELSRRIRGAGAEPGYGTPEECGAVLRRDIAFWQQVRRTYPQLAAPK
ncbi:MAG TPA: tripartite tricarboxylate transporter substrate binding protein [Burkholderiaceae bacterium]|nr:tripartite tricarboxylate transporter substrate binding protein [Burkholderiaceae bacterium]